MAALSFKVVRVAMPLKKRGKYTYGETQADIQEALIAFSRKNGYMATCFADAVCTCSGRIFKLQADDDAGVAVRHCIGCGNVHVMADGAEYLDEAELFDRLCICNADTFEITVGLALYDDSEDVRWLYLGCRCPACGLTGCYAEWKNEYIGYKELLLLV